MGVTALPSSLVPPRGAATAAAASRAACASHRRLDPTRIGSSTNPAAAAISTTKDLKRPRSLRDDEPPTKRRRAGAEDADAAARGEAKSSAEKNGVNRLHLSRLPPVRSPHEEVILVADPTVSVLQVNGTRRRRPCGVGGDDGEMEIDINALRAIKDRAGAAPLGGKPLREEEALSQIKHSRVGQSKPKGILSKAAASKSNRPRAAPKSIPPTAAARNITTSSAASKSIPLKAVTTSKSAPNSPPRSSIPSRAASKSIPPRTVLTSIPSKSSLKSIPGRTVLSLPEPPKSSHNRESVSKLAIAKTAICQSPPRSARPTAAPSHPESPRPLKELLAAASKIMRDVVRRREIEKLRAAARREVEQVVRTVEFNDPYIDYTDVYK